MGSQGFEPWFRAVSELTDVWGFASRSVHPLGNSPFGRVKPGC
jgi:hypothetical protein